MAGAHNLSKEFFELIKDIGESKSKQEEDKIIQREMEVLKGSMPAPNIPWKKMKEFLVRLLYVEMLGHDGSFGYIHAVNLTSSRVMMEKRTGYLAVSLMLHQDHDLILLLIANIQRDMGSSNYLEVSAALTAVMKLVNADTAPAILDNLMPLFSHSNELIRKKAVMAAHAFHLKSPSSVLHLDAQLRKMLCDKDPGVMGASLNLLHDMAKNNPDDFKDLVPSYVSILRQIVDHRLPKDYDYHRMPAPWIQIKLLQNLAIAGQDDAGLSEQMYEVLHEVMKRADMGINVGYAVMYECVRTVTTIYPNVSLLDAAATSISRFITSDNHNLKYLGIKSLAAIVQINSKYAQEHQLIVVDCLDDHDETLKRKTLDLLFKMTTPQNVVFIAGKLMDSLESSNDPFLREELVSRVTELAERFAPDNKWFIQTMNSVFEVGGDLVRPEIAHNLMRLIAEGSGGEDEEMDAELRMYAVREYYEVLSKPKMPELFLQLVCWVLGEYSYVAEEEISPSDLVARLCDLSERPFEDTCTRCYIISAITKIVAQTGLMTPDVEEIANKYSSSQHLDLQQRCYELLAIVQDPNMMAEILPMDASTEDLEPDEELSFLDDFIREALDNGARPYDDGMADMSPRDRELARERASKGRNPGLLDGMKLDAYDKPTESTMIAQDSYDEGGMLGGQQGGGHHGGGHHGGFRGTHGEDDGELRLGGLNHGSSKPVWGPEGLNTGAPTNNNAPKPVVNSGWAPQEQEKPPEPSYDETLNLPSSHSTRNQSLGYPAESEEEKRKKAMANQLFGGDSGGWSEPAPAATKDSKKEKKDKKPKKEKKGKKEKKSKKHVSESESEEEVKPKKGKKEKKTKKHVSESESEEEVVKKPAPAPAPVDDFDFLLGPGFSTTTSHVQPAPASVAPTDDLMDLLGDSTPAPSGHTLPPSQNLLQPSMGAGVSADLPSSLRAQFAGALPWQYTKLAGDANMEVHVAKVLQQDQTSVLITIANVSSAATNGTVVQIDPPRNFRTSYNSDPPAADVSQNRITFSSVPERGQVHVVAQMQLASLSPSMMMRGQISYMLGGANKTLSFQLGLQSTDLLRPAPLNTQQFGQTWESLGNGHSLVVKPTSVKSTQEFMQRVSGSLHLHPVETIQSECICAGRLIASDTLCLIHADVKGMSELDITCNSQNSTLAEMLSRCCASEFR